MFFAALDHVVFLRWKWVTNGKSLVHSGREQGSKDRLWFHTPGHIVSSFLFLCLLYPSGPLDFFEIEDFSSSRSTNHHASPYVIFTKYVCRQYIAISRKLYCCWNIYWKPCGFSLIAMIFSRLNITRRVKTFLLQRIITSGKGFCDGRIPKVIFFGGGLIFGMRFKCF